MLEKVEQKQEVRRETKQVFPDDQVFLKDGKPCWFLPLANITLLEVAGGFTKVYFDEFSPSIPRAPQLLGSST
ncbi:hypothetical protein [Xanthovirga aplysinae]|uniref:hypothetical protein n=1 Tax=Xanthovirga aplysinae TaxID=2529853 RepID=UPI0012BBE364|nr:hypothetical protein [Xanthovirga aplysinae]MTI30015.1 hypothetical protein [Xanthovirga aplysinae]